MKVLGLSQCRAALFAARQTIKGHRSFSVSSPGCSSGIRNVTVIGGGVMGSGIAQVAAQGKSNVVLCDTSEKVLDKTRKVITASVNRVAKAKFKDDAQQGGQFVSETMERITFTTKTEESVAQASLIIEAIVENLQAKHALFKTVSQVAPAEAILASNTSTLLISSIAQVVPERKHNFIGLHFFNPVPVMKLVEVIYTADSSPDAVDRASTWVKETGKVPVQCKDVPGFIVNQIQAPLLFSAMAIVEKGDATPEDIDTAMKLGGAFPMGPLALSDIVGLDVLHDGAQYFYEKRDRNPFFALADSKLLKRMVAEKKLGMKTGEGFYKYEKRN